MQFYSAVRFTDSWLEKSGKAFIIPNSSERDSDMVFSDNKIHPESDNEGNDDMIDEDSSSMPLENMLKRLHRKTWYETLVETVTHDSAKSFARWFTDSATLKVTLTVRKECLYCF